MRWLYIKNSRYLHSNEYNIPPELFEYRL